MAQLNLNSNTFCVFKEIDTLIYINKEINKYLNSEYDAEFIKARVGGFANLHLFNLENLEVDIRLSPPTDFSEEMKKILLALLKPLTLLMENFRHSLDLFYNENESLHGRDLIFEEVYVMRDMLLNIKKKNDYLCCN